MDKYIDAHCHLLDGVACGGIVNATCESEWSAVIAAMGVPGIYSAIGIHPWYVHDAVAGWDIRMADLLRIYPRLMVGEIGLDRARGDWAAQQDVFIRQMALAVDFGRVAHVHCVRAWDVMLKFLAHARRLPPVIVMHGFRANRDITRQLMQYDNIYFSFGRMGDVAAIVPENRILAESDGRPDVALADVVRDISSRRGTDMTDIIYNNTLQVINHGQITSD